MHILHDFLIIYRIGCAPQKAHHRHALNEFQKQHVHGKAFCRLADLGIQGFFRNGDGLPGHEAFHFPGQSVPGAAGT